MPVKKEAFARLFGSPLVWLALILALGGFLRVHNFTDWLHFELDQSRDARVVDDAVEGGPGELTLLGMKAGGTSLRLGPGFYYLEYLSALVFGGTPQGMAAVVPILSIASIGLFYLFARRLFGTRLSLLLTLLFSVSEYMVMYGRFAWNPNPIPFFSLLGFYALLRSVAPDARHPGRWFILAAFSIGMATHLHFLAFVALPAVAVLFLLIRRPRFSWKAWSAAVLAFFVFYVPVILNEIETDGANSKAFVAAVTKKSSKEEHSIPEKFVKDVTEHALGYLVVTTGYERGGFFSLRSVGEGVSVTCDARCEYGWKAGAIATMTLLLSVFAAAFLWWKVREREKSDLILLSGIWFSVAFLLFLPLSYDFAPRFFLVTAPIPFLFLGFLVEASRRLLPWKRALAAAAGAAILGMAGFNLYSLWNRFGEIRVAPYESITTPSDRILKERTRVTLEQQYHMVDFLKKYSDRTGYPVYMSSEPEHRRAIKYLLERAGVENDVLGMGKIYEEGIYVLILRSRSDLEDGMEKYLDSYDVIARHPFGTLTMIEFRPKPEAIQALRQSFEPDPVKVVDNLTALPRYTWREWWEKKNDARNDEEETE